MISMPFDAHSTHSTQIIQVAVDSPGFRLETSESLAAPHSPHPENPPWRFGETRMAKQQGSDFRCAVVTLEFT